MTDRTTIPTEYNFIDGCRKVCSIGIHHNFQKDTDIISFNSLLANKRFKDLVGHPDSKVNSSPNFNQMYDSNYNNKHRDMLEWLKHSCSGYYAVVDYNFFFSDIEDKAAFILKYFNENY